MIEELERQNGCDLEVVKPRAYKIRKAVGATLGTAAAAATGLAAASLLLL